MEATHEGLDFTFIDQNLSPYPNFSALEILTTAEIYGAKRCDRYLYQVTNQMTELCKSEPDTAHRMYYDYSQTEADALMDAIIDDTLGRLITPITPSANKWQALREMLADIDIVTLTGEQYQSLWAL